MNILLMIHSILRWVILLVAVSAIIKFLIGWLRRSKFQGGDGGLMTGFSGLMDLQATIGIVLLLWGGFTGLGFPRYRIEHGVMMILAVVVAHLSARWKNADDTIKFRNYLFLIVASLVLVLVGISMLPGGLSR